VVYSAAAAAAAAAAMMVVVVVVVADDRWVELLTHVENFVAVTMAILLLPTLVAAAAAAAVVMVVVVALLPTFVVAAAYYPDYSELPCLLRPGVVQPRRQYVRVTCPMSWMHSIWRILPLTSRRPLRVDRLP